MSKANIYFVITIDTESDHSYDWAKSNPLSFKSITESIPNVLEPLFKRYGAVATYLLSTEVLENYESVNVMKSIVGCELGTHLHPEYIQPKKKYFEYAGTHSLDFSNNYDPVIERDKIGNLTKLFKENIGYQPLVYRAGRYGFGYNSALSLMNFGYLVDTSVTPHISWKDAGGPDFRGFPDQPYFIKSPDGLDCLLEVPVSVIFLNNIYKFFNKPVELRPTFSNSDKMKRLIHKFIELYDSVIALKPRTFAAVPLNTKYALMSLPKCS